MTDGRVAFAELPCADLVLERVYAGGDQKNSADDPIGRLVPVGNQGGFRFKGSVAQHTVKVVVLYTSGAEVDWPDELDPTTGDFTYYGDNRHPGKELHETARRGNLLLRDIFEASRSGPEARRSREGRHKDRRGSAERGDPRGARPVGGQHPTRPSQRLSEVLPGHCFSAAARRSHGGGVAGVGARLHCGAFTGGGLHGQADLRGQHLTRRIPGGRDGFVRLVRP